MSFAREYLQETIEILDELDILAIDHLAEELANIRTMGGRVFILGVGGSAATASHAVNDFRKITKIEAYCPSDNVAELTARTNDNGWDTTYVDWLRVSHVRHGDAVLVLSVGGGTANASQNIVKAIDHAQNYGATILGIVGRDGGHTARWATACVLVPTLYAERTTSHVEGIASVVLHLLVTHPVLAC